ncbi:glycoside hydrolase family 13 protein [Streptococcus ruminantium]|uniref:Glycoside hydrolase family 13 protein n=1 Tax=Streptococcus ruminantium TaxID=1917441 RepID=A0ABU1B1R6_9STRE|nr:glycoside hydrolase family 13 protein [Streptococcus ruminantium]MDQ8759187.1 glycoside hydrolase family 13 protein [Streptococcus ruminantium]MDQ8764238.1 glycoside hydrolase family 13 protein [Streptococcus ruminantium]MDQ8768663.1 glycoside hydrolase family 13 protein [Streptococcus ruminantium]MDQ8774432.1 glycoside hydrolase family 13 protein [Streptococcus ruminantium]MDQ8793812.1 glycoside hydrolase family 13 protein [Streptococcus ruminantium]
MTERTALYHRPDSEYAYLYKENQVHLRFRTKFQDVTSICVHHGDPFIFYQQGYQYQAEMEKVASDNLFDYWQVELKTDFGRLQYIFELIGRDGQRLLYGEGGPLAASEEKFHSSMNGFKLPYLHELDRCQVPAWVSGTVWYQIFPDRFARGKASEAKQTFREWNPDLAPSPNDFFGGDLAGIIEHLDYLQDLGITGLYLCPIFKAPSNHKYDTSDYYQIDPQFGTNEELKQLVSKAHQRGMRVMLDAVFNHIGYQSKQWQDVLEKGERSIYRDWFHIDRFPLVEEKNGQECVNYQTFAFQKKMPKLNTAHPEVKTYLLDIARFWIEECDIDAWRLDVANEIDHQFWKEFRKTVLSIKPDLFILGEIWHSAQSWLVGDEHHSVMNYPLASAIKSFFLTGELTDKEFIASLNSQRFTYRQQVREVLFNLLDSHDTERISTTAKGDKNAIKAALVALFFQVGSPCIYYGTEVGLSGGEDPDCRRVMPWKKEQQDEELLAFVTKLIHLRQTYQTIIQNGKFSLESTEERLLRMTYANEDKSITLYFNQGKEQVSLPDGCLVCLANGLIENGQEKNLMSKGVALVEHG